MSIESFITAYRNFLELVHLDYQAIVRKKEGPALADPYLTVLGDYAYAWETRELRRRDDGTPVELSDAERTLLEDLIRSRPFGETAFVAGPAQALDNELRALVHRLDLELDLRWMTDENR